jgi:hypothetical protein
MVAVLAAGIYWVVKASSDDDEIPAVAVESYDLYCLECGQITPIPANEAQGRPKKGGKLQCPKCERWAGSWGPPDQIGDTYAP